MHLLVGSENFYRLLGFTKLGEETGDCLECRSQGNDQNLDPAPRSAASSGPVRAALPATR